MNKLSKRYIIKIPKNINIFYCEYKKILIIKNNTQTKSLNLSIKLIINNDKNIIKVTRESLYNLSNNLKKNLKSLQGLTTSLIKQYLIEVSKTIFKKLKFIGLGYKIFNVTNSNGNLIYFKLGYSHFIYFKLPKNFKIINIKSTKLFIIGNSFEKVNNIAAIIKNYKLPEPYKGKGILYIDEKVKLKEGKKN